MNMNAVYFNEGGQGADDQPHTFFTETSHKVYEHYMDYALDDPTIVRQLCTLLRGVTSEDAVLLRINSPGGRFDLAAQIVNAMRECEAPIVGIIEQECASAATIIFLACDQYQVNPWAEMMIHYGSYGAFGKGNEIAARVKATEERLYKVFQDVYQHFLSDDEIEAIVKGQDMYLTQDEIVDRLNSMVEIRQAQEEEDNDEPTEVEEADQST